MLIFTYILNDEYISFHGGNLKKELRTDRDISDKKLKMEKMKQ